MLLTFKPVKKWSVGQQYEGIPLASALLFVGIFATLYHVLWLPVSVVLMVCILLVETELMVDFDKFEVRRFLGPLTVKSQRWRLEDVEGVVLAEYKGATQYISHSQFNVIRAHSFILTARIRKGNDVAFDDVEMFEFASHAKGMEVLNALKAQHVTAA